MSFSLGTAVGYLDLDTSKFKSGFKTAWGELESFGDKTKSTSDRLVSLGSSFQSAGRSLTQSVTLPLVGVGTTAVAVTSKFDSSMSQVAAVSGATGESLNALRDKAKEMGATTKFSASEAADAMNYMAMAGWKTEDMLGGIEGIMNLAAASGEDLATTSDIVTDALTAFGLTAADSGHFADILAAASSNANTNVSMMGETFKYCAPIAGSLGFSVEDTAEAIGLMANAGIKSTQAGTALRTIMTSLSGEVTICGDSIGEVAIATSNADGSMRELSDIIADCRVAFAGLSESEKAAAAESLVGKNAMSGFLALLNAAPSDIEKLSTAIDGCDGTSKKMADTMQDNLGGQLTILKSTLEGLAISIGELLMPLIRKLVAWFQDLLTKINNLSEGQKKAIVTIAGVAAAIGPLLLVLGKLLVTVGRLPTILKTTKVGLTVLKTAITSIASPVVAIVAVIAVLVAAFKNLWDTNEEFRNKITSIWGGIVSKIQDFCQGITDRINSLGFEFESITEVLKAVWDGFCNFLAPLFEGVFQNISIIIDTVLDNILGAIDFFLALFKGDWEGAWDALKGIFENVWQGMVDWFNNIGNTLTGMLDVICGWFGTTWEDTWASIKEFFVNIWTAVSDFFVGIWTGIKDFFVGIWNGIVGAVQSAWKWITGILSTVGDWIYSNVIAPVVQFFTDLWNDIVAAYHTVIDPWIEIFRRLSVLVYNEIIAPIIQFFTDLWNSIVTGVQAAWDWIVNLALTIAGWWYDNVISPLSGFFTSLWNGLVDGLKAAWDWIVNLALTIAGWWNNNVVQPLTGFFTRMWDGLKNGARSAWDGIKSIFSSVATFFGNIFKAAWEKVKAVFSAGGKIFSGIKDGIVNAFSSVVNVIIKGLNTVISKPFQGLNKILNSLTTLDILGIKPFGWLTWRAPIPQIPLIQGSYATGLDYVPRDMLVKVHQGESIRTKQQTREDHSRPKQDSSPKQPINLTLEVDGRVLGRVAISNINDITDTDGKVPLKV